MRNKEKEILEAIAPEKTDVEEKTVTPKKVRRRRRGEYILEAGLRASSNMGIQIPFNIRIF